MNPVFLIVLTLCHASLADTFNLGVPDEALAIPEYRKRFQDFTLAVRERTTHRIVLRGMPYARSLFEASSGRLELFLIIRASDNPGVDSPAKCIIGSSPLLREKFLVVGRKGAAIDLASTVELPPSKVGHRRFERKTEIVLLPSGATNIKYNTNAALLKALIYERIDIAIIAESPFKYYLQTLEISSKVQYLRDYTEFEVFVGYSRDALGARAEAIAVEINSVIAAITRVNLEEAYLPHFSGGAC